MNRQQRRRMERDLARETARYSGEDGNDRALRDYAQETYDPYRLRNLQSFLANDGFGTDMETRSRVFKESFLRREKTKQSIERNGITLKELEAAREEGRMYGFHQAAWPILRGCFAAAVMAAHDEFDFTDEQCFQMINAMYMKYLYAMDNQELIDDVLRATGIEIRMDDPLEPVQYTGV